MTGTKRRPAKRSSRPPPVSLGALLIKGSAWFWTGLTANLKTRGMTSTTRAQGYVVAHITSGEHRASRIAKNLGISAQALSRLLSEMEKQGIILIRAEPGDRRAKIVEFNPEWLEYHRFTRGILLKLEEHLSKKLGKPLVDALRQVLESDWSDPPVVEVDMPLPVQKQAKAPKRKRSTVRAL